ncbi:MAG: site-specific DNA-methyltransferase [Sphingomonadaceae bacterium]
MKQESYVPNRFKDAQIEQVPPGILIHNPGNARKHPKAQIAKLKANISRIGFTAPILTDASFNILAGHGRVTAAVELNLPTVPVVRLYGLSEGEKALVGLTDNALHDMSSFDMSLVIAEVDKVLAAGFDLDLTGFEMGDLDFSMAATGAGPAQVDPDDLVTIPDPAKRCVSKSGELWRLGDHSLLCGNALEERSYQLLLGADKAQMAITDMPYNVSIRKHASGLGKVKHPEFAMASGQLSMPEFTTFLTSAMTLMAQYSVDGSIHFHFMDGAHLDEILTAGRAAYIERKAVCVWDKGSGGMGSLYRHQEEFVLVFKNGKGRHINNIRLGKYGRYRTTIWRHPGLNSFGKGRDEQLAAHPTSKPISLISEALKDCSKRGGLILDPFGGSGTTIMAAERTGRRAAVMEIEPRYVDVAIRRWQKATGKSAYRASDGVSFAELEVQQFDDVAAEPSANGEARHD